MRAPTPIHTTRCAALVLVALIAGCDDPPPDPPPPELPACAAELARHDHTVEPGQGPTGLGDGDTDENGILDRDEWGPLAATPLDADLDGTPDHEDRDDDGDGLLDIHDPERRIRAAVVDPFTDASAPLLTRVVARTEEGAFIDGAARAGDRLHVEGARLGCDLVVAFLGSAPPVNVVLSASDENAMQVRVPEDALGPVAVFREHTLVGFLDVTIVPADRPILHRPTERSLVAGSTITLEGRSLGAVTEVLFDGIPAAPTSVGDGALEVVVPDMGAPGVAPSGEVWVEAPAGASNRVSIRVVREVTATLAAPDGFDTAGLVVLHDRLAEADIAGGTATVRIAAHGVDLLSVADDGAARFEALALPADAGVEIGPRSTAVAATMRSVGALSRLSPSSLTDLRATLLEAPETTALADAMTEAARSEGGLADTSAYAAALLEAVNAADTMIVEGLDAGRLAPPPAVLPIVDARIEPMTTTFGVSLEQSPDTGVVSVVNDTALFLSAAATDLELGRVIVPHVSGAYDPAILGASGTTRVGGPSVSTAPRILRDTHVSVVTPGSAGPIPETPEGLLAQQHLVLRTVVEQFLKPLIEFAVGQVIDANLLVGLLLEHGYATVVNAVEVHRRGDVEGALGVVFEYLRLQARSVLQGELEGGPFLVGLLEAVFDGGVAAVRLVSERVARKLAPGISQIEAIVDGISALRDGITAVRALGAMLATPGQIDFDVTFGLAITGLRPMDVARECAPSVITIEGAGFQPRTIDGAPTFPEITIRDTDPAGIGTLRYLEADFLARDRGLFIRADGTAMNIPISEDFMVRAIGPLEVEVTHLEPGPDGLVLATVVGPRTIPVTTTFELDAVSPPSVRAGEMITLRGRGFDASRSPEVVFSDPATGAIEARLAPATLFADTIEVLVPTLPDTRTDWHVTVRQGPALCQVRTRPRLLVVAPDEPARLVVVGSSDEVMYSIFAAGTERRDLAPLGSEVLHPDISSSGLDVVYSTSPGSLFVVPVSGGARREILPPFDEFYEWPAWSPTGDRIALRSTEEGGHLHVIGASGGTSTRLTGTDPSFDTRFLDVRDIAWSPSGAWIAFKGVLELDYLYHLYVVAAAGGSLRRVSGSLSLNSSAAASPQWLSDDRLAFIGDCLVHTVNVDGSGLTPLNAAAGCVEMGQRSMRVSPARDLVAYLPQGSSAIRIMGIDGSGDRELVPAGAVDLECIAWSPDGRRLAYNDDNVIHLINADGTGDAAVYTDPDAVIPCVHWAP